MVQDLLDDEGYDILLMDRKAVLVVAHVLGAEELDRLSGLVSGPDLRPGDFDPSASFQDLHTAARIWENRARNSEEERNTLQQDLTILRKEFDDVTANAQWLADLLQASINGLEFYKDRDPGTWTEGDEEHLAECQKALDAKPGVSLDRLRARILEEVCRE